MWQDNKGGLGQALGCSLWPESSRRSGSRSLWDGLRPLRVVFRSQEPSS